MTAVTHTHDVSNETCRGNWQPMLARPVSRRSAIAALSLLLTGCAADGPSEDTGAAETSEASYDKADDSAVPVVTERDADEAAAQPTPTPEEILATLDIVVDTHDEFCHGEKGPEFQRYIVMHDTESDASPEAIVSWWLDNGNLVATHFVVGKDGHIVQAVPLDKIAHHVGHGDAGNNELYGTPEDGRDDLVGTTPGDAGCDDYGMNAWSVGIEMVHQGSVDTDYPEAQLVAVDGLVAYIDAYYGFESDIIDHNDWRAANTDCSEEFQPYLSNYQRTRRHSEG